MENNTKEALNTVQEAFAQFKKGALEGNCDGYMDYFAEDASYWAPTPGPFLGENKGKGKIRQFYESQTQAAVKLKVEDPFNIVAQGDKVLVEYYEQGTIGGEPFSNRVAIAYQVENGKITESREYLGDLSPFVKS